MAAVLNTEEGKQYSPVQSNTEENITINGPVKTSIGFPKRSADGRDLRNIGCTKNERRKWITAALHFVSLINLIMLFIFLLCFTISFLERSKERCLYLLPTVLADPCPDGWVGHRKKCYYFSLTEGNWTVGSRHCSSHNASLAVVDSQDEKGFLSHYKSPPDHWIGLQKDLGQPWRWVNGSIFTGELFKLHEEEGRRCAYLSHYAIASSSCTREEPWICSKEMAKDIVWISKAKT